jgi:hypothetical protein
LCDGIGHASIFGHGRSTLAMLSPCKIDYLKLALLIDGHTAAPNPTPGTTPYRPA